MHDLTSPATLEILNPTVRCGGCGFTATLSGTWLVEEGRLTFRAHPNLTEGRGPDLSWCSESHPAIMFEHLSVDDHQLPDSDLATLRAVAEAFTDFDYE